jgi:hypothetical protein
MRGAVTPCRVATLSFVPLPDIPGQPLRVQAVRVRRARRSSFVPCPEFALRAVKPLGENRTELLDLSPQVRPFTHHIRESCVIDAAYDLP